MPTIVSIRPQTKPHNGLHCEVVRAVTEEDGEAFDLGLAKTVVTLDDGTEIIAANIELVF